ncbi:Alpha/beta hydrolase fold protein [Tolypocladium paradoxum]|uniref:Alpha/beta hydrolase fold protein n=1 Tax=Tolypocladium paradoxum TaxID=94208 RepID=A0A2S4LB72_9HYPO|nr:Alpha/beta hydrolase fold protein [Tolypocladium paradoxum]
MFILFSHPPAKQGPILHHHVHAPRAGQASRAANLTMALPVKPRLAISERLNLAAKIATIIPLRLSYYITRLVFFALRNRFNARFYLFCAGVRMSFMSLSGRQIQHIFMTTRQTYETWLKQKVKKNKDAANQERLVHDVEPLESVDSSILWVGNRRKAKKFVLFFHGGGFVTPPLAGHFEWCWNAYVQSGVEKGVEVAVAFLQYTLCPGGRFPTQLRQAAAALGALLDAGVRPADIIVGGDSAGGNLTMQLLGHLLHPHEDARRIDLAEPLAAAFLVSPWLGCNTTSRSFRENENNDMLSKAIMEKLSIEYFKGAEGFRHAAAGGNAWAALLDSDQNWLEGVGNLVPKIYVTVGKREVLADHGIGLVQTLRRLNSLSDIWLEESEGEAHDFILLEGQVNKVGDATNRMKDWFKSVIVVN